MRTGFMVPDYNMVCRTVDTMRRNFPFLSASVIGRSHVGRAIFALKIGHGAERVLLAGGFHGSEWLTESLLLRFTAEICACLRRHQSMAGVQIRSLLKNREIVIVPCVNPDGTEIFLYGPSAAKAYADFVTAVWDERTCWNANALGVDINHNFDAGWDILHALEQKEGITGASPRRCGGLYPESEPETKALCNLCRRKTPKHILAFHSQGEEIFWEYGDKRPPRSETLLQIFASSSGYKPVAQEGLYAHGGFKDWFIKEYNRPGFTVEIGKGQNPLPAEDFDGIYENLREMLVLSAVL